MSLPARTRTGRGPASWLALALSAAALVAQQAQPPVVSERIEVVARAVSFDVVDAKGRPVESIAPADLELIEDGVARTILEVRRREPLESEAVGARAPTPTEAAGPAPVRQGVLVALDPNMVDNFAWKDSIRSLRKAAPALAAVGPVEVTVVGVRGFEGIACGQDPDCVRDAIDRIEKNVRPLDLFYRNRERFLREARDMVAPETGGGVYIPRMREEILAWFDTATRELVETEVHMLRVAQDRLAPVLAAKPRPLILVWVGGGDPDTGEFVRQFFNDAWSTSSSDAFRITEIAAGAARGGRLELERGWQTWAADGVQVVSWAPERPLVPDLASAAYRRPSSGQLESLASDPTGLFADAARTTGGALVRSGGELPAALESVRGRFVLIYQTDRAEPGWRQIELLSKRAAWKVRAPRGLPIFDAGDERPPELPVELEVEIAAGPSPQTESVHLATRVGVQVLLDRYPQETPLALELKLYIGLPSGKRVSRDARVALGSIPLEGVIVHELDLTVPAGADGYRVEVREATTGARGASRPDRHVAVPVE